jgi:hypothetical protein
MVVLVNPQPPNPKENSNFSITADLGVPDYTFTYRVDSQNAKTITQSEKVLTIKIPKDTAGDILFVKVVDGEGDQSTTSFVIEGASQPEDFEE